jgi:hypothetical protein
MATTTQDPTTISFTPVNIFAMIRALVNNGCPVLTYNYSQNGSVSPTNGTSGYAVGIAGPGTILIDFQNAILYINTGTLTSPFWQAFSGSKTYSFQTLTASGAISPTASAQYAITAGGAIALTLAAPAASPGGDNVRITVTSDSANGHTITFTGGTLDSGSAAVTTATFNAFKGASIALVSYDGRWKVLNANGVSFS